MRRSALFGSFAAVILVIALITVPAAAAQGQEMKDAHGMANKSAPAYGNDRAAWQVPITLPETVAVDDPPVTTTIAAASETTAIPEAASTPSVTEQARFMGPNGTGMQGGSGDRTDLIVLAFIVVAVIVAALYGYFHLSARGASIDPDHTVIFGGKDPHSDDGGFPPALSARYTGIVPVGSGGTARVFLATRVRDGQTVAVKVPLRTDEATGRSFLKEIGIWRGLVHQNIVRVCAVNILPSPYVEMEYFDRSLKDLEKPLSPERACSIVAGIAEGLAYAHEKGVIHRDLKPGNILLAPDGTPKIADWGLGRVLADGDETTAPGFSLHYAAPEQLAPARYGPAGAGTDLFQLGVVLYELLTGAFPYNGVGPGEYAAAVLSDDPVPPSAVEPALAPFDQIVLRCLEKDPATRYASAEAFLADLRAIEC